jgi:hypothetical protein
MRRSSRRRTSYRVGKGRPPLATRFKTGQSGNPKGRPKRGKGLPGIRKDLARITRKVLDRKISVRENGKMRWISKREAIVEIVAQKALQGDLKAATQLLSYDQEMSENPQSVPERTSELTPLDTRSLGPNAAMEEYLRMVKAARP